DCQSYYLFFLNVPPTPMIYTLSLHDALPIYWRQHGPAVLVVSLLTTPYSWITDEVVLLPAILQGVLWLNRSKLKVRSQLVIILRSEEHTSELQSPCNLVCRLLLEKKNNTTTKSKHIDAKPAHRIVSHTPSLIT